MKGRSRQSGRDKSRKDRSLSDTPMHSGHHPGDLNRLARHGALHRPTVAGLLSVRGGLRGQCHA